MCPKCNAPIPGRAKLRFLFSARAATCPRCRARLTISRSYIFTANAIIWGVMPFAGWWTVRSKAFLPAVMLGVVIVACIFVVSFWGELELSRPKRSLLGRLWTLWNLKHPNRYVAACFLFGALLSLALWLMLFDIAFRDSGWHLAAIPKAARSIFIENGSLSPFFLGMAIYPCWALGLAAAYFLGAARRMLWASVLLSVVVATCVFSAIGSVETLWFHVPATYFALLCTRAA